MNDTSVLDRLQGWYVAQCDGEWEHQHGLSIDTLDNPGWSISIALTDTGLQSRPFERFEIERTERNWIRAWAENDEWRAACGPLNLDEALNVFLAWAER